MQQMDTIMRYPSNTIFLRLQSHTQKSCKTVNYSAAFTAQLRLTHRVFHLNIILNLCLDFLEYILNYYSSGQEFGILV